MLHLIIVGFNVNLGLNKSIHQSDDTVGTFVKQRHVFSVQGKVILIIFFLGDTIQTH